MRLPLCFKLLLLLLPARPEVSSSCPAAAALMSAGSLLTTDASCKMHGHNSARNQDQQHLSCKFWILAPHAVPSAQLSRQHPACVQTLFTRGTSCCEPHCKGPSNMNVSQIYPHAPARVRGLCSRRRSCRQTWWAGSPQGSPPAAQAGSRCPAPASSTSTNDSSNICSNSMTTATTCAHAVVVCTDSCSNARQRKCYCSPRNLWHCHRPTVGPSARFLQAFPTTSHLVVPYRHNSRATATAKQPTLILASVRSSRKPLMTLQKPRNSSGVLIMNRQPRCSGKLFCSQQQQQHKAQQQVRRKRCLGKNRHVWCDWSRHTAGHMTTCNCQ